MRPAPPPPGLIVPIRRPILAANRLGFDPTAVERVDSAAGRYYLLPPPHPGYKLPSVTTVCKVVNQPYLGTWRGNVGNEAADLKMALASEFGTAVHDACEARVYGEPVGEHLTPWADGAAHWIAHNVSEIVATETKLASIRHLFAGTPDLVCRDLDGRLGIVDYKTSRKNSPIYYWQMAAYALMWEEMFGEPVEWATILLFKKDVPKRASTLIYKAHDCPDLPRARVAFLNARAMWDDIDYYGIWNDWRAA